MADQLEHVIVVNFGEESKAFEALSVLRDLDQEGRVDVEEAAVLQRSVDGVLTAPESDDPHQLRGATTGGLIGILIGILGGPFGVLLIGGLGALIGGTYDLEHADDLDDAISHFGRAVAPGTAVLLADVKEPDTSVIDDAMAPLGGTVSRRPTADVVSELEAVDAARRAAATEARKELLRDRHEHAKVDVRERIAKLREKFAALLHR